VKAAELTERRAMLIARTEAQREALSCYVARLQAPARLLEMSWRVTGFLRSPVIVTVLSFLLTRKKQRARKKRRRLPWLLQQGWRLFTTLKHFRK